MLVYRDAAGQQAVRRWCAGALGDAQWNGDARWNARRIDVHTSLGATSVLCRGEQGPRLVVLPAAGWSAASLVPLMRLAPDRASVCVVDLPGQPGLSAPGRPQDRIRAYRTWTRELLEHLGQDRDVVLVAHGVSAAVVLCAEPDTCVRGLVLVAPLGIIPTRPPWRLTWQRRLWSLRPSPRRSRQLLAELGGPYWTPTSDTIEWMSLVGRAARREPDPEPLPAHHLRTWRAVPTTVLCGEHDPLVPADLVAHRLAGTTTAAIEVVEGAGHLIPLEEPHRVVAAATRLALR